MTNLFREILFRAWCMTGWEGFYKDRLHLARKAQRMNFWLYAQHYAEWKTTLLKRRTF